MDTCVFEMLLVNELFIRKTDNFEIFLTDRNHRQQTKNLALDTRRIAPWSITWFNLFLAGLF